MNFFDSNAVPIDVFTDKLDLRPYAAVLPTVSLDNLMPPERPTRAMLEYMRLTSEQDLAHADMANPGELNEIIWYSIRGEEPMPGIARLPAFELLRTESKPGKQNNVGD